VRVWDLATHDSLFESNFMDTPLVTFSGNRVFFAGKSADLRTWSAETGLQTPTHKFARVENAAVHGDTVTISSIATENRCSCIQVWQKQQDTTLPWNKIAEFITKQPVDMFTSFGNNVATVSSGSDYEAPSTLVVYNAATGESLAKMTSQRIRSILPISSDSILVVNDGLVQHWRFNAEKALLYLISSTAHDWGIMLNSCKLEGAIGLTDEQRRLVQQSNMPVSQSIAESQD